MHFSAFGWGWRYLRLHYKITTCYAVKYNARNCQQNPVHSVVSGTQVVLLKCNLCLLARSFPYTFVPFSLRQRSRHQANVAMQTVTTPDVLRSSVTACRPNLLRPACSQLTRHASAANSGRRPFLKSTVGQRHLVLSAAQEQPDRQSSVDNGQIQSPTGSDLRPEVSESKLPAKAKEEPRVGLVGSIIMWGFLVVRVSVACCSTLLNSLANHLRLTVHAVLVCWVIVLHILKVVSARYATSGHHYIRIEDFRHGLTYRLLKSSCKDAPFEVARFVRSSAGKADVYLSLD